MCEITTFHRKSSRWQFQMVRRAVGSQLPASPGCPASPGMSLTESCFAQCLAILARPFVKLGSPQRPCQLSIPEGWQWPLPRPRQFLAH